MLDGYPRDAKADPTRPNVMWPGCTVRAFDAAGPLISRSRSSCVRFTSGSDLSPPCRPVACAALNSAITDPAANSEKGAHRMGADDRAGPDQI